jgi:hypothetical protein
MRRLVLIVLFAGAAAVAALFLVARGGGSEDEDLDDAYALMTRAMSRPGYVLYSEAKYTNEDSPTCVTTTEAWISEGGEQVRTRTIHNCPGLDGEPPTVGLSVRGGWYSIDREGKPHRGAVDGCRDATLPGLLFFLDCGSDRDVSSEARLDAEYRGKPVALIRSSGDLQGIDSRVTIDSSLHIDQETGLPIATESLHTDDFGGSIQSYTSVVAYTHKYVTQESLPENFFDPASLGIEDAYPSNAVDADSLEMPLYWLGETVAGEDGLPGLTLKEADTVHPASGHQAMLGYRISSRTFAESVVTVRVYARRAYEELLEQSGKTALHQGCEGLTEIEIEGARAAMTVERCYDGGPVVAEVQYLESVVVIQASITDASSDVPNPYATTASIERLARLLTIFPSAPNGASP